MAADPADPTSNDSQRILGACGHELDPWESHVVHDLDCPFAQLATEGFPTSHHNAHCSCPEFCDSVCCPECM